MMKKTIIGLSLVVLLSACSSKESQKWAEHLTDPFTGKNAYRQIEVPADMVEKDGFIRVGNKTYHVGDKIDISSLIRNQLSGLSFESWGKNAQGHPVKKAEGEARIYKQANSVILGTKIVKEYVNNIPQTVNRFTVNTVQGKVTEYDNLPAKGSYTYQGKAFTGDDQGNLTYKVDFDKKTGEGQISGLTASGGITLKSANITKGVFSGSGAGIQGEAISERGGNGSYKLGIFGSNAEEVAGSAALTKDGNQQQIGFAGKR